MGENNQSGVRSATAGGKGARNITSPCSSISYLLGTVERNRFVLEQGVTGDVRCLGISVVDMKAVAASAVPPLPVPVRRRHTQHAALLHNHAIRGHVSAIPLCVCVFFSSAARRALYIQAAELSNLFLAIALRKARGLSGARGTTTRNGGSRLPRRHSAAALYIRNNAPVLAPLVHVAHAR